MHTHTHTHTHTHRYIYIQVAIVLLDSGRHYIMRMLGERVKDRLRMRLYAAILQQEIGFFDSNGKGELMSMLGEDVAQMQMAVTDRITSTLTNFTTILYGMMISDDFDQFHFDQFYCSFVRYDELRLLHCVFLVHVCVCACVCVYIYIYIYHFEYIYIYVYIYIYIYMHAHTQTRRILQSAQYFAQSDTSRNYLRPYFVSCIYHRAGICVYVCMLYVYV